MSFSRCASSGLSNASHPSGISVPTLRQHAPRESALLSWGRFHVTMWSSLALLLSLLQDVPYVPRPEILEKNIYYNCPNCREKK